MLQHIKTEVNRQNSVVYHFRDKLADAIYHVYIYQGKIDSILRDSKDDSRQLDSKMEYPEFYAAIQKADSKIPFSKYMDKINYLMLKSYKVELYNLPYYIDIGKIRDYYRDRLTYEEAFEMISSQLQI